MRVFLKEWREYYGLTLEQLGGRIEPPVAKGTVTKWEEARPGGLTLGVIAAYAEALGRHVTDMYRVPPKKGEQEPLSLDRMAATLDPEMREQATNIVAAMARRRAS